jgi:hypothetical protein
VRRRFYSFFNLGSRWGSVVNTMPWPLQLPEKGTRYPLYKKLGRAQGLSGQAQKIFLYSPVLCLYFIRTCFFFLECPALDPFRFYLQHTTQTPMPLARFKPATPASDWPQTLASDCSATGIGGIRSPDRPACSQSLFRPPKQRYSVSLNTS